MSPGLGHCWNCVCASWGAVADDRAGCPPSACGGAHWHWLAPVNGVAPFSQHSGPCILRTEWVRQPPGQGRGSFSGSIWLPSGDAGLKLLQCSGVGGGQGWRGGRCAYTTTFLDPSRYFWNQVDEGDRQGLIGDLSLLQWFCWWTDREDVKTEPIRFMIVSHESGILFIDLFC